MKLMLQLQKQQQQNVYINVKNISTPRNCIHIQVAQIKVFSKRLFTWKSKDFVIIVIISRKHIFRSLSRLSATSPPNTANVNVNAKPNAIGCRGRGRQIVLSSHSFNLFIRHFFPRQYGLLKTNLKYAWHMEKIGEPKENRGFP